MFTGKMYINGGFVPSSDGNTFSVRNPYNLQEIGRQAQAASKDIQDAIAGAAGSFSHWKGLSAYARSEYLRRLYQLMGEEEEMLARTITQEQGKPLAEARGEVRYAASYVAWYAEEGIRVRGDILEPTHKTMRMHVLREPVGPVAIITPWNFPLAMFVRKMAPALAAGCPVVVKPAEQTPFTAVRFFELVHRAGFPPGVCQLLTGIPQEIGRAFMEAPEIRKLSFTGSTQVGKMLMAQSAETLKKLSLELGGHAPFIVFADADLDKAVQGALDSKFRNCGQVCIATNRLLVEESIADIFTAKLVEKASRLKVGDGFSESDMGPVIDESGFQKIASHVDDALNRGATLLMGGQGWREQEGQGGYLYAPTILGDVTEEMRVMQEETFGPVLPLMKFSTEEEAIRIANQTPFGLAAYFFTENASRVHRVSEALEYGMVGVNTGRISSAQAPFGGIKMSGYGREGGYYGIEEYLHTKYVGIGV